MTNLHARTIQSRPQTHLNRPFRFNPAPQSQATGNLIYPARTWTFSIQPSATVARTAISPVMHPAVPVMPIPNINASSSSGVAPIMARARSNPAPATNTPAPSVGNRLVSWLHHLGG